jgi:hypothetical protein
MAAQQKVTIEIPDHLTPQERQAFAAEVLDLIVERTREKGLDKNNKPFKGYSDSYMDSLEFKIAGKDAKVDLTLSGEMLDAIELLRHKRGQLVIGYQAGDPINGKVEGNRLGTYGQSKQVGPKRDHLGITKGDLAKIASKYPKRDKDAKAERVAEIEAGELLGLDILSRVKIKVKDGKG